MSEGLPIRIGDWECLKKPCNCQNWLVLKFNLKLIGKKITLLLSIIAIAKLTITFAASIKITTASKSMPSSPMNTIASSSRSTRGQVSCRPDLLIRLVATIIMLWMSESRERHRSWRFNAKISYRYYLWLKKHRIKIPYLIQ